jgi:hypothetical protein
MKTNFSIKIIWLVILLIGTFSTMQAQIGFRAGVLISKQEFQNGDLNQNVKSKFGGDIALVTEFPKGSPVTIGPEFHWLQKGAKIEDLSGPIDESIRTFNYIEIPVLLRIHLGPVFLLGGPSAGYLLDGTDKDMDGNTNDIDLDFYKRTEFGAHVGGGISFGPLCADIRYIVGLTNIFDDDTALRILNRGYGAGLSLMF